VHPDDVVAPPYDVVGPAERAELAAKSPYNAIAIDLPVADQGRGLDQYENATWIFGSWLENGVVRQDAVPGFYVYRMTFHDEHGQRRLMTGLLGALGLDLDQAGEIMPHEQTMPKDRQDRLSLLRSARLNTSPIWGLSLAKGLTSACRDALGQAGESKWRATDQAGVVHELWPVTDEGHAAAISKLAASAKVLLADGHHRYQTACTYALESRAANGNLPGPYDLVLAFVVELSEEELSIRAIHRLLEGVPSDRLNELLAPWYRTESAPEDLVGLPATSTPGVRPSVEARSPTTISTSPTRSWTRPTVGGCGLPATVGSTWPATATAESNDPAPGSIPSGVGKVASSLVPMRRAPA